MPAAIFDALEKAFQQQGPEGLFDRLAQELLEHRQYHELFDARLMASRRKLGLSVLSSASLDETPADKRDQLEAAYLAACREVGHLLLAEGKVREAWMYLRPLGDTPAVAEALARLEPTDENAEEIIEVALHEGVAPALGMQLVLKHYGTCNSITTFDQALSSKPLKARREAAEILVRHLHRELSENLRHDIERQEGARPAEPTIRELVADRDWLFAENNYHIDTSHLNSVVRFAVACENPETLRLAIDMTEYGRRLSPQFQYAGEEPFTDAYAHYGLYLSALAGESVDAALAHFRSRAEAANVEEEGTAAAEQYVALLARIGRHQEAFEESARLLPGHVRTFGIAPSLSVLAERAGAAARLAEIARQRDDVLSFAAGLVAGK